MNTVPTIPTASALAALVPFSAGKAYTHLLAWQTTTSATWSAAPTKLMSAKHAKKDAEDASQVLKTESLRATKALRGFLEQFAEFQQVAKTKSKKRKATTTGSDTESTSKRARDISGTPSTGIPSPKERTRLLTPWLKDVKTSLRDRASMQSFPQPPVLSCSHPDCRRTPANQTKHKHNDRTLQACEHVLLAAYKGMSPKQLRKERHEWHPDHFAVCKADSRELWQRMAGEMFTSISGMLREG